MACNHKRSTGENIHNKNDIHKTSALFHHYYIKDPKYIEEDSFATLAKRRPNWNSEGKRQYGEDVDPVFLRFGKMG